MQNHTIPRKKHRHYALILALVINIYIFNLSPQAWETKTKVSGNQSNLKAFARQRKLSAKLSRKGPLMNERKYLQIKD